MASPHRPALSVAAAAAALQLVSAQIETAESPFGKLRPSDAPPPNGQVNPSDGTIVFGGGMPSSTVGSSGAMSSVDAGDGSDDTPSNVVSTVTTTNRMGQPLTLMHTYSVVNGFEMVTTINLLGQSTTIPIPLITSTVRDTGTQSGLLTTYTSTDAYGQPHPVTTHVASSPRHTSMPSLTNTGAPSSSIPTLSDAPSSDVAASPTASLTQASTQSHTSSMSHGAIAAAVVVPIIVVILLIALALFFLRRRKRNSRRAAVARDFAGMEGAPAMQERDPDFVSGAAPSTTTTATGTAAPPAPNPRTSTRPDSLIMGAPVITGDPSTSWHNSVSGASQLSTSASSTGSDPFRDPALAAVGSVDTTSQAPSGPTGVHNDPVSPVSPIEEQGHERFGEAGTGGRALSPMSEGDEEEAEIEDAQVRTAQRASVVRLKPSPPRERYLT